MKKIALFIYSFDVGGAENVASIILSEYNKHFDTTLVLMNDTIKFDIDENQKIHYLEKSDSNEIGLKKLLKIPLLAYKYKKFCEENDIELSLSLLVRSNFISLLSKIFGNKSKLIISEHSLPSNQYSIKNIQSFVNKFLIRKLYPKADEIIAVSKGVEDDLKNNFFVDIPIKVIFNPIDVNKIIDLSNEECLFPFDKYTFITIGRLDYGKNHELMIKAFSKIKDKNTQLIIIGTGSELDNLRKLIKHLSLEERVFLVGYISNPYKWLKRSNCFLLSSRYESFGIVIIEALACGLPVISTNCESGPKEILGKKEEYTFTSLDSNFDTCEFGILAKPEDEDSFLGAMSFILENKKIEDRLVEKSYVRANAFDIDKIIKSDYINIIE